MNKIKKNTHNAIRSRNVLQAMKIFIILFVSISSVSAKKSDTEKNTELQQTAKSQTVTISGKVLDQKGEPMVGISVRVKANPNIGGTTDNDGKFLLASVPAKSIIIFSYLSYTTIEYDIAQLSGDKLKEIMITMTEAAGDLEEVVITATGTQKKVSVVGAITPIDPSELKAPTRSIASQLVGRVAGMTYVQSTGQPGQDGASFIIRGINSVVGSSSPLILVDGLKRTLEDVDPNDIESFAVLKDASATAVYGLEGANGIVVIKTRSGVSASKPVVSGSYSASMNNSTAEPKWVDAYTYASLKNEAAVVRGLKAPYPDAQLEKFSDGDNDTYPNTDWYNTMFKGNNLSQKGNFNIAGGGNVVTYFASGGFYTEEGMFNGKISEYDSNANYSQFNFRANLNADITSTTSLGVSLDGRYNTTTEPGQLELQDLFNLTYNINPTLYPAAYSNGTAPVEPNGLSNPYSVMTKTGFRRLYQNTMSANVNLTQHLDMLTKGLSITALASFTKLNKYTHFYNKQYQTYEIDYLNSYQGSGRDENGNLLTIAVPPYLDEKMRFSQNTGTGNRMVELQATANYRRMFMNNNLEITGLLMYKQREVLEDTPEGDSNDQSVVLINALPSREQSLAGRVTAGWMSKYFVDINFGGSGSQMFTPDKRWSYFPSFGIGWLASGESFWEPISPVVSYLKLRGSFGTVGSTGSAKRFGYLAQTGGYPGYSFGFGGSSAYSTTGISGVGQTRLAQLGLTWEQNEKTDLGIEFELFKHFRVIFDLYKNHRKDQLVDLSRLPTTIGLPQIPKANLGESVSEGFDLDITYSYAWKNFRINYIKALVGYNTNEIIENGQTDPKLPYQSGIGLDYGRTLSYIDLGLFKDQADIDNSPVQNWNKILPGDIKYKDINGDGVINTEDRIWIANQYPKWTYSMAFDFGYKDFDLSFRFVGKSDMFRNTVSRTPFSTRTFFNTGYEAAIYQSVVGNHWTPESYSGNKATENPNATYPRLAIGSENINNAQTSSFWMKDASYIRLADVQFGYTYNIKSSEILKGIYFYARGENLHTFSSFTDWNPEQTNPASYPLKSTLSLGMEIKFKF